MHSLATVKRASWSDILNHSEWELGMTAYDLRGVPYPMVLCSKLEISGQCSCLRGLRLLGAISAAPQVIQTTNGTKCWTAVNAIPNPRKAPRTLHMPKARGICRWADFWPRWKREPHGTRHTALQIFNTNWARTPHTCIS